MVRSTSLSKGLTLLGCSAVMLFSSIGQQATASTPTTRETKLQIQLPSVEQLAVESSSSATAAQETRLLLKLNKRRVYLYQGNKVKASYPVAVGKPGWETPTGTYKVLEMERNPAWQNPWNGKVIPPGPKNPLGLRWVGFWTDKKNFIGFHGTANESLIGQAVSHGCVRMRNKDVAALFEQVSIGTPVIVQL